jgi:signal transduction histidine kinase
LTKFSFKTKLVVAMLLAALLPYMIAMIILSFYGKAQIKEGLVKELTLQTANRAKEISGYFGSLSAEFASLAKFEIMDDALTGDIDKRISTLLATKKHDWKLNGELLCVNTEGVVVATTAPALLGISLGGEIIPDGLAPLRPIKFVGYKAFTIGVPIKASFDQTQSIGRLVMVFKAENIASKIAADDKKESFLYNSQSNETIAVIPIEYSGGSSESIYEDSRHITAIQKVETLPGWSVVTQSDKSSAFAVLDRFMLFLTIALLAGAVLIVAASLFLSSKVIKPIQDLSAAAEAIGKEQAFEKRVPVESGDEIGVLSTLFNQMVENIQSALGALKQENSERLRLFVALVEMFKKITASTSEKEAIDTAISQIELFWPTRRILFHKDEEPGGETDLFILHGVNFDNEERIELGYISAEGAEALNSEERQFFCSILEMVELQIERIGLWEKTEAASRAKSAFIANMSHELRTPLNSVIGFSQFLQSIDEFPKDYINIPKNIETAGKHLLSMINDILDMAKIEAGKVDIEKEIIGSGDIINEVCAISSSLAAVKKIEFSSEQSFKGEFFSDPKLLKQILLNLLSNAIKFTEEGAVTLSVSSNDKNVIFAVKDSGIGLSKDDIAKLFTDFTQIENPLQKKYKGTGLGLSLCKKLAVYLGGDVVIESEGIGKGSTAILTIPKDM